MTLEEITAIHQREGIQGVIRALGNGDKTKTAEEFIEVLRREKNAR